MTRSMLSPRLALITISTLSVINLGGCGEETSREEVLEERLEATASELNKSQQALGQANQKLGVLSEKMNQLEAALEDERSSIYRLESQIDAAALAQREAMSRSAEAANFIQEKNALLEQLRTYQMELQTAKTTIAEDPFRLELEAAKARLAAIEDEHPQYMLSLLEDLPNLEDNEIGSWTRIALELFSPRFAPGQALRLTLPLPMLDHRGSFTLKFGSLETEASAIEIQADKNQARVTFANAAEIRSSIDISASKNIVVGFGPTNARSEIVFAVSDPISGLTGTTINFDPVEVRLGNLPVVQRSPEGDWTLVDR